MAAQRGFAGLIAGKYLLVAVLIAGLASALVFVLRWAVPPVYESPGVV